MKIWRHQFKNHFFLVSEIEVIHYESFPLEKEESIYSIVEEIERKQNEELTHKHQAELIVLDAIQRAQAFLIVEDSIQRAQAKLIVDCAVSEAMAVFNMESTNVWSKTLSCEMWKRLKCESVIGSREVSAI